MQHLTRASAALFLLLTSCLFETKYEDPSQPGFVNLVISLKANSNALFKTASADTTFTLDTLKILLSASGVSTTTYTYPISVRSDTGNIAVSPKIYALAPLRTWTARIIALDTTLNPGQTDTVYNDSVSFTVLPGDTALVTKTANPTFSILRARLISNSPGSLTNNVKWVRLRVDGIVRDSMPVGPALHGVSFGNGTTGSAVGDSGTILHTTNTGVNWFPNTSPTSQNLNAVSFPSANVGYAVGNAGTVLKTTNATTWLAQTSGTAQNLNGAFFSSNSAGYAVGNAGTIRISDGTNWSAATSGTSNNLYGVFSTSSSIGYAVGAAGTIVKTGNSGSTWSAQTSGTTRNLYAVHFPVSATGFAVGDSGTILKTTNSGGAWAALTSGTTKKLLGVYFTTATAGWAVGEGGTMLKTSNGTAWSPVATGTLSDLYAIGFTSNEAAATAVGDAGSMLVSASLTSWNLQPIGTKSFDMLLTYKYLKPNVSHTLILDAIDTLSSTLRGYQATKTITLSPGKDTTLTPNSSLTKCGYITPACSP